MQSDTGDHNQVADCTPFGKNDAPCMLEFHDISWFGEEKDENDVQKDSAQTHYRFWSMNVDPADCERGKAEYKSVSVRN